MDDLVRELDDADHPPTAELDLDLELDDDPLFNAWLQRSESELSMIEDLPTAPVHVIRIRDYPPR